MVKIVGILYKESLKVFVYENGHQIQGKKCLLNNCAKTIALFAEFYNVNTINIMGDIEIIQIVAKELKQQYSLKTT